MKFSFTLILSFAALALSAQVKYNTPVQVDPEVQQLLDRGDECLENKSEDCKHLFLEAIAYGKQHKVTYMDNLYFQLGRYFDVRSQYDSALHYIKRAYELADKNDPNSAYPAILNSLGANHFRLGEYDEAATYMLLTVEVLETQDKPLHLVYAYNNLATLIGLNENYNEAIRYYKKGYAILEDIQDTTLIASLASNLAIYVKKTDDFPEARKWALKAIELGERYNRPDAYSYGNYIMGTTEEDLDQSIRYIEKAVNRARTAQNKHVLADALDIYGYKLSEKGRHEEAKKSINEAIDLHIESSYNTGLLAAYANAGKIYYNAGAYKTSAEYFQKYEELYEKSLSDNNKKRVNELNTKYQTEKKERQIAQQELKILKQQSNIFYTLLGAALLVSVLGGIFIYHRNAQKLKLRQVHQEKEIAILNSFILGEERERNRISRDLHDSVAAQLGAAKMGLQSIPFLTEERRNDQLEKTARLIGNLHGDIRRIAHNLLPVTLEKEGLVSALFEFVGEINQLGILEIKINNQLSADFRIPKRNELVLYRIIQELVNNVIQHAGATEAAIGLSETGQQLTISVSDNGIGFTSHQENQGLYSIRERSSTIGGTFSIKSQEKRGSVATLIIKTGVE